MCSKVRSAVLQNRLGQRTKPQSCEKRHEGATSFQLLGQSAASFQLMHYRTSCLKHVTTNQSIFVASADDQSRWAASVVKFIQQSVLHDPTFLWTCVHSAAFKSGSQVQKQTETRTNSNEKAFSLPKLFPQVPVSPLSFSTNCFSCFRD